MNQLLSEKMHDEVLFVASVCVFLCTVERPKETLANLHDMGGPLRNFWWEGCVSKVSLFFVLLGERQNFKRGGQTTCARNHSSTQEFDATMGYPEEDVAE